MFPLCKIGDRVPSIILLIDLVNIKYDLDSVLRFEQFTTVEDIKTHRGPKAVQLRMVMN